MEETVDFVELAELNLGRYLQPIDPDPGFINRISSRISDSSRLTVDKPDKSLSWIGVILSGFVSGLMIWWVVRAFSRNKSKAA
ncbi:MAG TPA: hypothetical protein PKD55_07220 [Bellilinea sp.]|nr:hypothetical protein [Bellilinea sp.]